MWLFFALASRFIWSLCGATDQVLSRAHRQRRTRSVMVLVYCCFLPFVPVAWWLSPDIRVPPVFFYWLVLGLACHMTALIPYYKGLQREQAYNIVPYMELTPVFLTLLAVVFRHESLTPAQIAAGALVIFCGFAFSWDFAHGRVKGRLFALMSLASLLFAVMQLCIKNASTMTDAWTVTFWFEAGQCLIGLTLFAFWKSVRKSIVESLRATKGRTALIGVGGGLLSFLAFASITYAFKTAPTTGHVAALSGTQPFFSFLLAFPLAHLIPGHYEPVVKGRERQLKIFLLFGICLGIYMLAKAGG